jgi:hypothetical protein
LQVLPDYQLFKISSSWVLMKVEGNRSGVQWGSQV